MPIASVTDSLVHFATNVVGSLGLAGIFVLMLAESACIPIPSEATMLFAGFSVSEGHLGLVGVTVAGVLGNLVGSWIAYGVGFYGRRELVESQARRMRVKPSHLHWADRWFSRYGEATVFFTRILPVIRTFISLPAGIARMPFVRFTTFTLLGCVPWVFVLALIGQQVGHDWTHWKNSLGYADDGFAVLLVALVVYGIYRWRVSRRTDAGQVAFAGAEGQQEAIGAGSAEPGSEREPSLRPD